MKFGTVVGVVVLLVLAGGFTWWISTDEAQSSEEGRSARLTPKKGGPYADVFVKEPTHQFGRMVLGESDVHTFVIHNKGEVTLQLGEPDMTCQCTVAQSAPESIAPGETGKITLKWEPTAATSAFNKGARIPTNDPDTPVLVLAITGIVDEAVVVEPPEEWDMGGVTGHEDVTVTGYVFSRVLEDLQVTDWETDDKWVTAETEPMSDEELAERDAVAGTKVVATVSPEMPLGQFSQQLTLTTNATSESNHEIDVRVTGTRLGPIQFLPKPGTDWEPRSMAIDLGEFPASQGAEAGLTLFVDGMPKDKTFQIKSVDSPVEGIGVSLKGPDGQRTGRQKFTLQFQAKPGMRPQTRLSQGAARVTLQTNHPEAEEIQFYVEFIARPK